MCVYMYMYQYTITLYMYYDCLHLYKTRDFSDFLSTGIVETVTLTWKAFLFLVLFFLCTCTYMHIHVIYMYIHIMYEMYIGLFACFPEQGSSLPFILPQIIQTSTSSMTTTVTNVTYDYTVSLSSPVYLGPDGGQDVEEVTSDLSHAFTVSRTAIAEYNPVLMVNVPGSREVACSSSPICKVQCIYIHVHGAYYAGYYA